MIDEPLEPFDHALLQQERASPLAIDAGAKGRVLERLETIMVPMAVAAATTGTVAHIATGLGRKAVALALAMGVTGAAVGSGVTAAVMRRPVVIQAPPQVVTQPVTPTAPSETEKPVQIEGPQKVPARAKVLVPSASTLATEQDFIETARAAILSKRYEAAISVLSRHGREFQVGALAEEREALTIQALGLSGRDTEAKTKASEFRRRFAGSMLTPAIDAISPPDVTETPR